MSRIVRITYGGTGSPVVAKVIDFPQFIYRTLPPDYERQTLSHMSISGIDETLNVRADALMDLAFRNCLQREEPYITLKRNLKQWKLHVSKGYPFTLALDSTDTVLTTLTNNPAAGATAINLTSVTGIVAGRSYVVRNEFDLDVVKVASVASLTVNLTEPLDAGYFAGDRFRSELYWPARLIDKKQPILIENGPLFYDVEIRFAEDLNSL